EVVDTAGEAHEQQHRTQDFENVQEDRQAADIDQVVVQGERGASGDAPDRAEVLEVHPDQPVIPAHTLREPAGKDAGPFGAHDEPAVVVDPLAAVEQDHGVLEVFRVNRDRVLPQGTREGFATIEGNTGGDAVVGQ